MALITSPNLMPNAARRRRVAVRRGAGRCAECRRGARQFHGVCCGGAKCECRAVGQFGNHRDRATPGRTTAGRTAIGGLALGENLRGWRDQSGGISPTRSPACSSRPWGRNLADQHARRDNRRRRRPDGRHYVDDVPFGSSSSFANGVRRALDVACSTSTGTRCCAVLGNASTGQARSAGCSNMSPDLRR